jgi:hypothetical protein
VTIRDSNHGLFVFSEGLGAVRFGLFPFLEILTWDKKNNKWSADHRMVNQKIFLPTIFATIMVNRWSALI